jgi:predicted extracellular nuclease
MARRSALFALLFAAAVGAEVLPIHQVQGPGPRSPYEGQRVTVRGVVTGVTAGGFFLQETFPDQDPATSEGVYVYTGFGPGVAPGDLLEVEGKVVEYTPAADPVAPPLTELVSASWQRLARDYPLPSPVPLSLAFPDPGGGW